MYNKALYFPYINVPKGPWLTRMLLYWDQIGTIVPSDYFDDKDCWDEYSLQLIDKKLLNRVSPMEHIFKIPRFRQSFIELVDKDQNMLQHTRLNIHNTTRIHIEKLDDLAHDLIDRGLAKRIDYRWYRVESHTAKLFMGYLASTLGVLDDLRMEPVTDSRLRFSIYLEDAIQGQNINLRSYQEVMFEKILPVPLYMIPARELLTFKNKYGKQLNSFRSEVELAMDHILCAPTPDQKNRMQIDYIRKFQGQVDEIKARMQERKWPPFALLSLLAYVPMGIAIHNQNVPQTLFTTIPPLIGAVAGAYLGLNEKRRQILSSPAAYAALVQRSFNNPHKVPGYI